MNISIETKDKTVVAISPFNPDLPGPAKKLGGKWSPSIKAWLFDSRDEARVRELYRSIYGTDGTVATGDLVTVRATIKEDWLEHTGGLFLYGRRLPALLAGIVVQDWLKVLQSLKARVLALVDQ